MDWLLAVNAARATRKRLTEMKLYEELRVRGYDGGCDAVRRHAAAWKQVQESDTAAAFVPLTLAP